METIDIINKLNKYSLRLSCYLICKLYNINIPFHPNINDMFRYEIVQYWIDNCNLLKCTYFQYKYATWEIVQANPDVSWNYGLLSCNPNITWEIVQANPDKPWNYGYSSRNPNITWEIVQDYPDINWRHYHLSMNPNITWKIVQANPDINWNYNHLSANPNITWEIVQDNPDKPWNYLFLSKNPNITWEIVRDNPKKQWYYCMLSSNPNITWKIVQDNPDKLWDYNHLSFNDNITWEIVQANPNDKNWNYDEIIIRLLYKNRNTKNPFFKTNTLFLTLFKKFPFYFFSENIFNKNKKFKISENFCESSEKKRVCIEKCFS